MSPPDSSSSSSSGDTIHYGKIKRAPAQPSPAQPSPAQPSVSVFSPHVRLLLTCWQCPHPGRSNSNSNNNNNLPTQCATSPSPAPPSPGSPAADTARSSPGPGRGARWHAASGQPRTQSINQYYISSSNVLCSPAPSPVMSVGSGSFLCAGWCRGPGSGWSCTCTASSGSAASTPPPTGQSSCSGAAGVQLKVKSPGHLIN